MLTETGQFLTKTYDEQAPRSRASAEIMRAVGVAGDGGDLGGRCRLWRGRVVSGLC